jgi:hypothetical protein
MVSHSLVRSLRISSLEESKGRTTKQEKGEERRKEEVCDFQRGRVHFINVRVMSAGGGEQASEYC